MKLNIANPATGQQKSARPKFSTKNGYTFRISGGNDKQGFTMKQGVLTPKWVRFLLSEGQSCFQARRVGERKRKSVRGCIVAANIAALSLIVIKQGENNIPGLTDTVLPQRLGPKRATKIRRFFNLTKEDDVRKFVVCREVKSAKNPDAKPYTKAPKIQRLVTPIRLQRRRHLRSLNRRRNKAQKVQLAEYKEVVAKRQAERKAKLAAVKS
ncbi:hypothetical protein PCASD_13370 [Puccinia coronata f. sp. avenae]|uniref:40S ribosomal protein S6 n=1 Tax=Puccinia coronata f. sp. avenae TaxID=200324 RepID=A0A2N5TZ61_9BASI|nr:hypothetical protein PCASD_13370 [Puccinia coronata f. sp. avenae]